MTPASWITRVGTNTVDGLVLAPCLVAAVVVGEDTAAGVAATLTAFALSAYNRWYVAGRTGQSWGRMLLGVRLVSARTGKPVGVVRAALRDLAHLLDSAVLLLGWLLPLFTSKRQTIADMVCRTIVVKDAPAAAPSPALSHG